MQRANVCAFKMDDKRFKFEAINSDRKLPSLGVALILGLPEFNSFELLQVREELTSERSSGLLDTLVLVSK